MTTTTEAPTDAPPPQTATLSVEPHTWTDDGDRVLILKRIDRATRTTRNGFLWPAQGSTVTAPDWDAAPKCGGGLHGWPWGMGLGEGADQTVISDERQWIEVVEQGEGERVCEMRRRRQQTR